MEKKWWKCEKHDIDLQLRSVGHGKTEQYCPECDKEKPKLFDMFKKEAGLTSKGE